MPKRKARVLTPDQLAALARGRAVIAANRAQRVAAVALTQGASTRCAENPHVTTDATGKRHDPPLGSVDVDCLSGDALKAYAKRAGVWPRDIDNLTEDRLRQNVKLQLIELFELIEAG